MGCPTRHHHPHQKCLLGKGLVLISLLLFLGIFSTFQLSTFSNADIDFGEFLHATTGLTFGVPARVRLQGKEVGETAEVAKTGSGLFEEVQPDMHWRKMHKRQANATDNQGAASDGQTKDATDKPSTDTPSPDPASTNETSEDNGAASVAATNPSTKAPPNATADDIKSEIKQIIDTTPKPNNDTDASAAKNESQVQSNNNGTQAGDKDSQPDTAPDVSPTPQPKAPTPPSAKPIDTPDSKPNSTTTTTNTTTTNTTKTATTTTTTTPPPPPVVTTTLQPELIINQVCNISLRMKAEFGANVSLEDLRDILFIPKTLNKLIDSCPIGSWCLEDDYELATDKMDDIFAFCDLSGCMVDNIPQLNLNEERRMTLSTLMLLCSAGQQNISETCLVAIRKMTHVTRALMKQKQINLDVCDTDSEWDNCTGACYPFSIGLYCMCGICDHHMDMFTEFGSWQSFFNSGDMMESQCGLSNSTDCTLFRYSDSGWISQLLHRISNLDDMRGEDAGVIVGVVAAILITVAGIALVTVVCIKKGGPRRILGYSRNRIEYQEVSSEEEFD